MHKERIQIYDTTRGYAILAMIFFHIPYSIEFVFDQSYLIDTTFYPYIGILIGSLFIILSALNATHTTDAYKLIKRGLRVLSYAMGLTVVTYLISMPIHFGILHVLGTSLILVGILKSQKKLLYILILLLLLALSLSEYGKIVLGFPPATYAAFDYYPLIPWALLYGLAYIGGHKIDKTTLQTTHNFNIIQKIGQRSLVIYLVHQPILLIILYCIKFLT
jgi:uncharacterized membrane protein